MADIAMLVAEEYERRVKSNCKKSGETKMAASSSSSYDIKVGSGSSSSSSSYISVLGHGIRNKVHGGDHKKHELVKWVMVEPKSQIGLAASNGFFSA